MFLDRPNARVFYEVEGESDAPLITLINGYSRSSKDFRLMAKFLTQNGLRVLRFDNRGAGQTETTAAFTLDEMVGDVVSLWDHLEAAQSHVLGISYGGVISILLAHANPTRVKSLSLVSTTPSSFFLGLDNDLSSQTQEQVEQNIRKYFSEKFAERNPVLFKSMVKETSKVFMDPVSRARAAEQRAALKKFDFTALLHGLRMPTLILHGEADNVATPEAADVMARAIKHAELELVPDTGHLFLAEAPTFFYERVLRFLQAHS